MDMKKDWNTCLHASDREVTYKKNHGTPCIVQPPSSR